MLFLILRAMGRALVSGSVRVACEKEHSLRSVKDDGTNRLEVSRNKLLPWSRQGTVPGGDEGRGEKWIILRDTSGPPLAG